MLAVSEVLMQEHHLKSFDDFLKVVTKRARGGEIFLQMDVKPPYSDTPENWEARVEAAFYSTR